MIFSDKSTIEMKNYLGFKLIWYSSPPSRSLILGKPPTKGFTLHFTTTDIDHPAYSSPQWTSPHNNATHPHHTTINVEKAK
jgi:hypothetical protein